MVWWFLKISNLKYSIAFALVVIVLLVWSFDRLLKLYQPKYKCMNARLDDKRNHLLKLNSTSSPLLFPQKTDGGGKMAFSSSSSGKTISWKFCVAIKFLASHGFSLWIGNLVPRMLFPGFGGGAENWPADARAFSLSTSKAREKSPGD